ncbi:hypothetical protein HG537_0G04900 [Torulaspora globosa]|uniref:Uncharacterized protein n=1 Tax=Torulaspora globosa TaxID=48254 RepID=A0A7H9I048_9SACH|nr:hypothetical protein HG537_0G04900 [Torulaspora sp. CBS 2947]
MLNPRTANFARPLRLFMSFFTVHKKVGILMVVGLLWALTFIMYPGHGKPAEGRLEKLISVNAKKEANFDVARKIAYVSRHIGTTVDFQYMAKHLQLENVDYYDASKYYEFQASAKEYRSIVDDGTVEKICSTHDLVFVSDSLADGWPFIMDGKQKCKNVVFVITNRFDIGAVGDDKEAFIRDFNYSLNRDDEYRAKIVVNNLFEVPYLESRDVHVPEYHPLIRPFGYNSVDAKELNEDDDDFSCLIISRVTQDEYLMSELVAKHTSHHCKVLPTHYGGPKTLSKYESIVVHLPYQVSVMKMWENLAYGVLMIIPSPDFFTQICTENHCAEVRDAMQPKEVFGEATWSNYLDFFLPDWEKCFIQYNSWEQLDDILTKKDYLKDINHCRNKMEDLRELGLQSWKEFLVKLQN